MYSSLAFIQRNNSSIPRLDSDRPHLDEIESAKGNVDMSGRDAKFCVSTINAFIPNPNPRMLKFE